MLLPDCETIVFMSWTVFKTMFEFEIILKKMTYRIDRILQISIGEGYIYRINWTLIIILKININIEQPNS